MPRTNPDPTRRDVTAAGIYAVGTAMLCTETVYTVLLPLMKSLIDSLVPGMSEEHKQTLSALASYGILLPFLAILSKTQYSSYRRAIVEYNIENRDPGAMGTERKSPGVAPIAGAAFKSTATGAAAWSMFSKIPGVGRITGAVAFTTTFVASFCTDLKFLSLHGQRDPSAPTEETNLLPPTNIATP